MKKSKFLIPLFASALLFSACAPSTNVTNNDPFAPGKQPAANLYAFQAATSIGLIGNMSTGHSGPRMARSAEETQAMINEIMEYLPSAEAALAGMDSLTNSKEEASDKEGYQTKLTISYKDIALKDNTFTMYYNETNLDGTPLTPDQGTTDGATSDETAGETVTDSSSEATLIEKAAINKALAKEAEDEDDDDEDSEDEEKETKIEGIIVTGDIEYAMTGSREIDPVDNEMETTFEYHLDETTLVTVEQEIENGESSFEYEIEENGETIYEYSIEIQNDEVELEVEKAGVAEREYSFSLVTKDGKQLIKADYENGKEEESFLFEKVVNSEDNSVSYQIVA